MGITKKAIAALLISALFLQSCATIFTGSRDRIYFKTNVEGASVVKDGNTLCKTPCSALVKRSLSSQEVEISKEGYETKYVPLQKSFNAVSILNLLDIIFWGIDLLTGAVIKYDPKHYNVELVKSSH